MYAVETVRMLADRGVLQAGDDRYELLGEVAELDIPPTLHALIAARLDALAAEDRGLLQDASVLGKSFTPDGLGAISGLARQSLEPRLRELARKEFLELDADPRSPERGMYTFTQAMIREVAYAHAGEGRPQRRDTSLRRTISSRSATTNWPRSSRPTTWRRSGSPPPDLRPTPWRPEPATGSSRRPIVRSPSGRPSRRSRTRSSRSTSPRKARSGRRSWRRRARRPRRRRRSLGARPSWMRRSRRTASEATSSRPPEPRRSSGRSSRPRTVGRKGRRRWRRR